VCVSLVGYAAFGEGARQMATSHDGGEPQEAEPLMRRLAVERLHQFPADMFRDTLHSTIPGLLHPLCAR
jgi:hypothetical protein